MGVVCLTNDDPNAFSFFPIKWVYHICGQSPPFGIKSFSKMQKKKEEECEIYNNLHMFSNALGLLSVKHLRLCCRLGQFFLVKKTKHT